MHPNDKAKESAGVTKYATVDAIQLVRAACEQVRGQKEIEVTAEDGDIRLKVRVRAF